MDKLALANEIALLREDIANERERCAKIAEQYDTWNATIEKTDHNDLYTGEYETVQRTGPRWKDGAAIAKAIREHS
jgi:hypothetical protein